jgi:hypothetical protein
MEEKVLFIWGFQLLNIKRLFGHHHDFKITINMALPCRRSGKPFEAV